MSLLNKFSKKKEKEQLDAVEKTADIQNAKKETDTKKKKTTTKETEIKKDERIKGKSRAHAYRVLVRPLVSEKATRDEVQGKYTFVVDMNANKEDIKKAVDVVYGVRPVSVRTSIFEGKRKRFGLIRGKRQDWKKAIIALPKGRTINTHEGV